MINNISNELKKCGIYKINYSNGKIYIGQALSVWKRAHEHNEKNKYPCDLALKKYDATIEILEEVEDVLILDDRETYWINFFDATNKEKGYNICQDGNASGKRGSKNLNASLSEEQLQNVINLLINRTDLSYSDIAEMYNVSPMTIFNISNGYRYFNSNLIYPLRENNHDSIKKTLEDYFENEEELIALKEDLLYRWDLSIEEDIPKKYNIPLKIVIEINLGEKFKEIGNFEYPIRKKNIRNNKNFSIDDIYNILSDLQNTRKSMDVIGQQYGIHRSLVSKINRGQAYIIKNFSYPAR